LWYHRLPDKGSPTIWEEFVLLVAARFGPQFTGKPLSMPALGRDVAAREGMDDNSVLFEAAGEGDEVLHTDNSSGERDTGNGGTK
jgi:hypothetical protein